MAYQAQFVRQTHYPSANTPLVVSRRIDEPSAVVDDKLPEGVDFSEGGWATDAACALIAILFFASSWSYGAENKHFMFMHLGTALAHFFGGAAHRFFPNRASDGVGMVGFYVSMIIG